MISATLAMSAGIFLWLITYSSTTYSVTTGNSLHVGIKLISAILPNTAITWAFNLILSWETRG
jgi:hypothetical protein